MHEYIVNELKTEEGYSTDIYPWRYISAQCPHYVSMKKTYIPREMLCGHSADIYLQRYIVRTMSFFDFQLWGKDWYQ